MKEKWPTYKSYYRELSALYYALDIFMEKGSLKELFKAFRKVDTQFIFIGNKNVKM